MSNEAEDTSNLTSNEANDQVNQTSEESKARETAMEDILLSRCYRNKPYKVYVLLVFMTTYLINQLDRYMLGIVTKPMSQDLKYGDQACMVNPVVNHSSGYCNNTNQHDCEASKCKWDYNGQGFQYELLAGPIFIVIYTFAGIPLAFFADVWNRKNLLAFCLLLWSAMTLVTGFVQEYWQLALTRFILGFGQAGCTPLATSLIAYYFSEQSRATALGFYNWGIYIGYSMSYAVGNFVTVNLGWRWSWYISGMPGLVVAVIIFFTIKEPPRESSNADYSISNNELDVEVEFFQVARDFCRRKAWSVCKVFLSPSLLLLCLAGSIRNAAGYVWAYNTQIYYVELGQTPQTIGQYMAWIPSIFGCIGVVLGGFISDRVVKRVGPYARLLVLITSQAVAAPFVAGALYFNPPAAFYCLIPGYIIGEMWVGITLAVALEFVPASLRTSAVAVYLFIISNIAGIMPLLVPPLKNAFMDHGYSAIQSLRAALYILYPGFYVLGAFLFFITFLVLRCELGLRNRADGYQPVPQNEADVNEEPSSDDRTVPRDG